jgi:purine nucleosidase
MMFPKISHEKRLERLQFPAGKLDMVLDTDTYNEIDDQFALTYALLSPERLNVQAIYAAPFHNEHSSGPADGMEKSYSEILKLLAILGKPHKEGFVFKGAAGYLNENLEPFRTEASQDLIRRAMARPDNKPLYIVGIAAITNVASAILMEPKIIEKIVVVWLGGHALHWPNTAEFNLQQDARAARVILESGVPLVLIPCMGVTSHLLTTASEMEQYVRGRGTCGDYLYEIFTSYQHEHSDLSKVIWDLAAIAYLLDQNWVPTELIPCPVLSENLTWGKDPSQHMIRYARHIYRDPVFNDLFVKLGRTT